MRTEISIQQPEFTVQNGAVRLVKAKTLSDSLQMEYQTAEGLTAEMLTYLPGEEVLDFDSCSPEHLAMVIQKWCEQRNRPSVQPVDPLYEEFLREEKLSELQKACQEAIYKGVEVSTSEGTKRFSLTLPDQINLIGLRNMLDKGSSAIPYHADGEAMRLWSVDDVQAILQAADRRVMYHRVYFSLLHEWLRRTAYPEFLGIDYGDALPDGLARSMAGIMESTTGDGACNRQKSIYTTWTD
ncbi:MAG: hypothetical protein FWE67_16310 [Planctomycetaceae bacterium]|nr:hypothetical protein [Planctomycetaceae bacterium]